MCVFECRCRCRCVLSCRVNRVTITAAAPGYFRHALNESEREDEWSQHKKVLEVPAAKGVRRAVPPQFPYFYVQFGLGDGLAHIIDSRQDFGDQFARGVLAGLLELDDDWMARPKPESRQAADARTSPSLHCKYIFFIFSFFFFSKK